jgi:hypothetical protein
MDERHRLREIWVPVGAALFVAGLVVNTDWMFTVLAAAPSRHLGSVVWPWIVSLIVMLFGIYVIAAAVSPAKWLWLPGKAEIQGREDRRVEAARYVTLFASFIATMDMNDATTMEQVSEWHKMAAAFVASAYGSPQTAPFMLTASTDVTPRAWAHRLAESYTRLVVVSHATPVRDDFSWGAELPWRKYVLKASEYALALDLDEIKRSLDADT